MVDKTHWAAAEIYSLRLPRLWRIMEGFRKLGDMRSGDYSETVSDPHEATQQIVSAAGEYGREVSFDCLPLEIQAWANENQRKARCNGAK